MRSVFMLRVICNTPSSQVFSLRMLGEKVKHFMLPLIPPTAGPHNTPPRTGRPRFLKRVGVFSVQ
jgi:hypothetical protein